MKQNLLLLCFLTLNIANAQLRLPQPSPFQSISQDFGMGKLILSYSRPALKGREPFKENGLVAPLGKVWRTGANAATTLTITDEVSINGINLKAGKYGILTIPEKKSITLIITKDTTVTSPNQYKPENDLTHVELPILHGSEKTESFTMEFANVGYENIELQIKWGFHAIILPITTNIKDRLRTKVEAALSADKPEKNVYSTAANFYYEIDKDYTKAIAMAAKAIADNPKSYNLYLLKAKAEKELGDKVAAKADAESCVGIATEAKNDDFVRAANDIIKHL